MNDWLRVLLGLPEQASTVAYEVDAFHYFVIITTMIGATAVALMAAIFILRYRNRADQARRKASPHWEMGLGLEVALIGTLAALFVGWWWYGINQYMRILVPPPDAAEVYVVAKQWMFKFSYPEGKGSVHTLYVPAGQPIKLVMTSRDVIHDFYVPAFRVKQDIVPGLYTTMWFEAPEPGVYEILCAEFCGTGHSEMRGTVVVLPPSEYAAWLEGPTHLADAVVERAELAQQPTERFAIVDAGRAVALDHGCLRCHTTDGTPHIGPSFANLYGSVIPLVDGGTIVADEAYLTRSMMDPLAQIHRGYQPVMPSYKGLLQPAEVAALLELMKALREGRQPQDPPAQAEGLPVYPNPIVEQPLESPERVEARGGELLDPSVREEVTP